MNKELLHAGYQLHLVFDEMVQEIRKDSDNWIMIIEKNIDVNCNNNLNTFV